MKTVGEFSQIPYFNSTLTRVSFTNDHLRKEEKDFESEVSLVFGKNFSFYSYSVFVIINVYTKYYYYLKEKFIYQIYLILIECQINYSSKPDLIGNRENKNV